MSKVYLLESKTKSRINEQQIRRQLSFDLQTLIYLIAMEVQGGWPAPIAGVIYNVIRRTEHRQGKKETQADLLTRLQGIIEANPDEWFMRWKVEITPGDVAKFRRECLDPILENLCKWWEQVQLSDPFDPANEYNSSHWRHPYGVWNVLDEGGVSDLDEYLASGNEVGLQRVESLFTELQ